MERLQKEAMLHSALFRGLTEEELHNVFEYLPCTKKKYEKKDVILEQGETVQKIGIIMEGRAIGTKLHYDGSTQILWLLKKRDIVGLESVSSSMATSPCMLVAGSRCQILFFTYASLFITPEIYDSSKKKIWQSVINILCDKNIKMLYRIDILSKRTLRERVITFPSIRMEKKGANQFDIGMTQDQFAQYLCVNRSVLSKELNKLKRDGLISYQKSRYTVYDIEEEQ